MFRSGHLPADDNDIHETYARYVPLVLMLCMRSYLFMSVSAVPDNEIADALLMRMSMPLN